MARAHRGRRPRRQGAPAVRRPEHDAAPHDAAPSCATRCWRASTGTRTSRSACSTPGASAAGSAGSPRALADFERLNRRMHNKQMIADNRAAIVGGRNIGDEYMGLNPELQLPRPRRARRRARWRARPARCSTATGTATGCVACRRAGRCRRAPHHARDDRTAARGCRATPPCSQLLAGRPQLGAPTSPRCRQRCRRARSAVHTDPPSRAAQSTQPHARGLPRADALGAARGADQQRLHHPGRDLHRRPARAGGARREGAHPHQLAGIARRAGGQRPLRRLAAQRSWAPARRCTSCAPTRRSAASWSTRRRCASGFIGLHVKAMVVDRERSFIGSMNLDPRSEVFNAEMGVIVDSPALGQLLAAGDGARHVGREQLAGRVDRRRHAALAQRARRATFAAGTRASGSASRTVLFKLMPASYY